MNVLDHLKTKTVPEIKEHYINNTIPAASAMMHVTGDFNLSTLIRNSNFFGYEKVFYVGGKKQYDRRGTVGTHNYIDVTFIKTEEEFVDTINNMGYTLISIENNVNYECQDLFQFMDDVNVENFKPIFIFGEEQKGLSDYILTNSSHILTINGKGTVRSLNVGTASGIVLGCYSKFF